MENDSKKGRPSKAEGTLKREHFSVWVSADQKRQINELIEKSGLSASQFFLTLALDVPFKRPQKRSLPKHTADTIRILEQLSGILSLAVLKSQGHKMLTAQWQQSSQRVRLLADLIGLWVFESFEIRSTEKTLAEAHAWLTDLGTVLPGLALELESKTQLSAGCRLHANRLGDLLEKYRSYYLEPVSAMQPAGKLPDVRGDIAGDAVHQAIENALYELLEKVRS